MQGAKSPCKSTSQKILF
uniref:Uncharacterized protein n=1 Tax=Anguilla anguilla TaxID=7936 RepID=A0A0E9S9D7_ANGAN